MAGKINGSTMVSRERESFPNPHTQSGRPAVTTETIVADVEIQGDDGKTYIERRWIHHHPLGSSTFGIVTKDGKWLVQS